MLPSNSDLLMRARRCSSLASSASSRKARTPRASTSYHVTSGKIFIQSLSLQTIMKKGKKRKFAETDTANKGEKRRKDGSGGGCASYLHLRLDIVDEGGRDVDLSPEYMENHLVMALK